MPEEILRRVRRAYQNLGSLRGQLEPAFVHALTLQGWPRRLARWRVTLIDHAVALARAARDGTPRPDDVRSEIKLRQQEAFSWGPKVPLDPPETLAERHLHACWLELFGDDADDSPALLTAAPGPADTPAAGDPPAPQPAARQAEPSWTRHPRWKKLQRLPKQLLLFMHGKDDVAVGDAYTAVWGEGARYTASKRDSVHTAKAKANHFLTSAGSRRFLNLEGDTLSWATTLR
jgi:hypothetical protein